MGVAVYLPHPVPLTCLRAFRSKRQSENYFIAGLLHEVRDWRLSPDRIESLRRTNVDVYEAIILPTEPAEGKIRNSEYVYCTCNCRCANANITITDHYVMHVL